jgi:hypothetical protein
VAGSLERKKSLILLEEPRKNGRFAYRQLIDASDYNPEDVLGTPLAGEYDEGYK